MVSGSIISDHRVDMPVQYSSTTRGRMISPHDRTHVSCEVATAGGGGEVLLRVQAVSVNHEVTVRQVSEGKRQNHNGG